jgi:hypothetical protein
MNGRYISLSLLFASIVVIVAPQTVHSQSVDICNVPVCFTILSFKNCGALVTYTGAPPFTSVTLTVANNVTSCTTSSNPTPAFPPPYRRFSAHVTTGAPPTRTCRWNVVWNKPGVGTVTDYCLIDSAGDGLPVELMDFEIE